MTGGREFLVPPGLAHESGEATLVVEKSPGEGTVHPLSAVVNLLGKAQSSDVVLDSPWVSRRHAEIVSERGVFRIRDIGSTNGTAVNGTQLAGQELALKHGDSIELGKEVILRFQESSSTLVFTPEPDVEENLDGDETTVTTSPHGTVTILFSDIEGSPITPERLGDQRAQELLHTHNAIIREQIASHQGFEVKTEGDAFMVAFQSARSGLLCAIAIQRAFAEQSSASTEEPIRVRIGLHSGEVIKDDDDFYGKNVILAARIAAQADGGQILVSALLKELTESAGDIKFGDARDVELKGIAGVYRMHELLWD